MAENASPVKLINLNNNSPFNSDSSASSSLASSPRSSSPITGWTIKYKTVPKKPEPKGVWDGYKTKEDFMMMHLR